MLLELLKFAPTKRERASLYIYLSFSVTFYEFVICGAADYRAYGSLQRSEIPSDPSGFHYRIPFRSPCSSSIEHERNRALCTFAASGNWFPPPSSSLATLISRQNRCALHCRPDRMGTLIYLVSDRFITPTRVRVHPHE